MKLSKKTLAILAGLTIGMSGSAFAASADSFTDVPKDHWAYQALDYLAQEGVIDGMGDSTFQGGRTMTRYEMASIVAKAMQKNPSNIGDQAVLEKLEGEFGTEIKRLTKRVDAHDKQIKELQAKTDKFKVWGMMRAQIGRDNGLGKYASADGDAVKDLLGGRNGDYNNRFYMDLEGSMKVNDHATARFTIEKNARYRDSEAKRYVRLSADGTADGKILDVAPAATHQGLDTYEFDQTHNGTISNIWVELQLGPKHDWYTNIGRKWNGIGMQNLLLGGVVDGVATYHPIEHGHGWWFSGQYWEGASNWHENSDLHTIVPLDTWSDRTTEAGKKDGEANDYKQKWAQNGINASRSPIVAAVDFWGPLGKYMDATIAYAHLTQHKYSEANPGGYYTHADAAISTDLKIKPFKNFSITTSYVRTNGLKEWGNQSHPNRDLSIRADYGGTDLNKVGSWGLWARWQELGALGDFGHDDEWATREPTYVNGSKGWSVGFKCVPWKNVEWETVYHSLRENFGIPDGWGYWSGHGVDYQRHILRSMLDFHF